MKKSFGTFILLFVLSSLSHALEDGKYTGKNLETGRNCSVSIFFDGDYLKASGIEYLSLIHI